MDIKNRRNSAEFNGFSLHKTLCLTESFVLRNRLHFIYKTLVAIKMKDSIKIGIPIIATFGISAHLCVAYNTEHCPNAFSFGLLCR